MNRHAINRATTIALAQRLHALAPAGPPRRRVGRIPRPAQPKAIENSYHATLVRLVCDLARDCFDRHAPEILRALVEERRAQGILDDLPTAEHHDARGKRRPGRAAPIPPAPSKFRGGALSVNQAHARSSEEARKEQAELRQRALEVDRELRRASEQGKRAAAAIDRAARDFAEEFNPRALHDVVLQFGKATDRHSRLQLDQQLRSAIGVPLSAIERPFRDQLEGWAALNVDLIVTVPERYFDRLRLDVLDAFQGGTHPATLAEEFQERYEMSDRDAERIARDQVLTLQADLNQERMTALGVERYCWRSANDGRVRDNHEELAARSEAGETFAFDDPPMGGGSGPDDPGNPGSGVCCRCFAEPVLDDLIG